MSARTEKIYEMEPYCSRFEAHVVGIEGDLVTLDRTAFYPGGGGQDSDVGTISGNVVIEVRYKDGTIVHKVPGNAFIVGQKVEGFVEMERRIDLMRAHTGEHLLFSELNRLVPDLELVKIAITPSKKSFIVKGKLDLDIVLAAERFVNKVIVSGMATSEEIVGRGDPKVQEARVKLDRIPGDKIRLVRIGDVDLAACAGVHVSNTSEIGMLLVEKLVSARPQGDFEIEFSVGAVAVQKALGLKTVALKAADILGSRPEDAVSALENLRAEMTLARDSIRTYARASLGSLQPSMDGDVPVYAMTLKGLDRRTLSEEATKKVQDGRSVCILVDEGEMITLVIAAGKDSGKDASLVLKKALGELGGKGGGNKAFATGGADPVHGAMKVMEVALKALRETNV